MLDSLLQEIINVLEVINITEIKMNKIGRCTTMSACFVPRFSSLYLQPKLLPVQCLLTSNQFNANFSTSKLSLNTTKIKSEVPSEERREIMTEYKKRLKERQTEMFK